VAELILQITMGLVPSQVTYWPRNRAVGQGRGLLAQRRGRYVAGSAGHRDRTPPDLARALIDRYSNPGDLILDPFVGTATMLVEAVRAGRDGLGLDIEPGWMSLARANLALAARHGATGRARVIHANATRLPARVPTAMRGTVDLVLTSPPPSKTMPAHRPGRRRAGTRSPAAGSTDRPRVGRMTVGTGLGLVLAGCDTLLRPGGLIAIAVGREHADRSLLSLAPDHVLHVGLRAGLVVVDNLYADRRGTLIPRHPGDDLTTPPRARTGAIVVLPAVAACDVAVFQKPDRQGATASPASVTARRGAGACR
jgi:SAM-dependent methyltransferase